MTKNLKKLMMAGIACIALCGTTLAAPAHHGQKAPARAPQMQKAPTSARAPQAAHKPAPAPHKTIAAKPMSKPAPTVAHNRATQRHEMRHTPPRRPTTPCHRHRRHECNDCHYDHNGWVEVGAGIIGGIIGALIAG